MADTVTPLMLQYQTIKAQHPNDVLFFRLGDFYEMFDEDAVSVSRLLNLTLTHRTGRHMCGIPYHAAKSYIRRLLKLGKRVAICEQVSLPSNGKGLAERKVVEVITPGTAIEEEYLEQGVNNYLAAMYSAGGKTGFAYIDVTTSAFFATEWETADMEAEFAKELGRCMPRELLLPQPFQSDRAVSQILSLHSEIAVSWYPSWKFSPKLSYERLTAQFQTANLRSFSLDESSPAVVPAGFLLEYLAAASHSSLPHVTGIHIYRDCDYVVIDDSSRRNLEIASNLQDGSVRYTLLETVNCTVTAMGSRLLRRWLFAPLTNLAQILKRQEDISFFTADHSLMKRVRSILSSILDVERLSSRIAMDRAHAKELQALRASLVSWLAVRKEISGCLITVCDTGPASRIISLIENAVMDDPSTVFTEGRLIKQGWSQELDRLREVHDNFNVILEQYTEEEKELTGISNLKVRYNRLNGYYLEVSKGKLDAVPPHFILRRSLVNGDRYTTERLQELEQELNSAGERIVEMERNLFFEIRSKIKGHAQYLLQAAGEISYIDVCAALAHTAVERSWGCPQLSDSDVFHIEKGRHPVVEMHIPVGQFVPNDMDFADKSFALITGPNMAGKSTFLRQNALIALLAQTGSFVPAERASIGIVDRIFCRVGASDNLARGESTFLVEMTETAHILRSATARSLVIMDEVGRGTSTEDGLSIAWAVSEYLLNRIRCKTLFATHYHELTRLEHPGLLQLCLDVLEQEGQVVFLKRIRHGSSANSFGIHVARLAGIPDSVIRRAEILLDSFHNEGHGAVPDTAFNPPPDILEPVRTDAAPGLFSEEELVLDEILSLDTDRLSPLEALQILSRWKKTLSGQ